MEIHTYGPQEYDILVEVSIRIAKPWSENNLIYIYKLNIFLANTSSIKTENIHNDREGDIYIPDRMVGLHQCDRLCCLDFEQLLNLCLNNREMQIMKSI